MWIYENPPTIGKKEIAWYDVLLDDGFIDEACWWCDHWYCYASWNRIVAYRKQNK